MNSRYLRLLEANGYDPNPPVKVETPVVSVKKANPIRPTTWADYVGQQNMRSQLDIHTGSALARGERLDHVLLIGPPGCGKTTVSRVIATAMGVDFDEYVMPIQFPVLENLVRSFTGVLLLDEIHRAKAYLQESLLTLLEDGYLQLPSGERIYTEDRITVIGATTEPEKVIAPLYDRFPIQPAFDDYTDEEMGEIVMRMAKVLGARVDPSTATALGRAAGGTPRKAKGIVSMLRDMQQKSLDDSVGSVLRACRLTDDGLTVNHLRYLDTLNRVGGTAGIDLLANHLRLPKETILDLERLLVRQGRITYGKRGRSLTP